MDYKEKAKKRKEFNIKILEMLKDVCEKSNCDIRLGQLIYNIDSKEKCLIDPFYEEPVDMYNRYKKALESFG